MMGKTEENNAFEHFSHGHQFVYINKQSNAICFGCRLNILPGKFYYKCESTCSFFLHQECFNMPKSLQHPVDPIHRLTLLTTIPSSSKCNACRKEILGFSYACANCSTYYHTLCLLALPLSIEMSSHCHKLDLEFCPPYDFECDLCKKPSYKGWLYHCSSCEFDAHISCAITHTDERKTEKCDELMELLSIYMKGTEETSVSQDQLHQYQAQQTPSYQFSDQCFSIDLTKSQQLNDEQTRSMDTKEKSNVAYVTLANEIGSEVWMGLGREMEKAYHTNDSNKERSRSSCCPDILQTLFCLKK
ncbi:protein VACUOLELESS GAMETOPHYTES-like [Solanum lycopersicum]|uniref:protein VACUOLELESS GAMETOPHYTES-like n=1 Tax=Solanum lycopersicum TaxID=4081 RepID=UPI000532C256|nr:glutathione-S-transferase isoform X1 [Solanum lycopersicum]